MDPFLAQVATLCRDHATTPKWVFVPSRLLGHTLAERLAREGTAWANLRFTVPRDLAVAMAAPALVERGLDPAPEGLGPALVMRLLLDLPEGDPSYFRPLADQPAMAEALWATIRELRLAGVTAETLPAAAFAVPAKHAELVALLGAYERHLAERRLADTADVYREALRASACPIAASHLRLELPGALWSPLERRLLDALPGTLHETHAPALPGAPLPRRLPPPTSRPSAPASDAERLAFLMEPSAAPALRRDGTVALFRAAGREAEIEHVMRLVAAAGLRLDDVEVACTSAEQASLVWEKATRHGWPVTLAAGVPATQTRPARALLGFLDWAESRFGAVLLRRLLQSGDLGLDAGDLSPGQAARVLARAKVTWERTTYGPALEALARNLERRAADPEADDPERTSYLERAGRARRLAPAIEALLALVPAPDRSGRVALGRLVSGARTFVDRSATVASALDAAGADAVRRTLDELLVLAELSLSLPEAVRLVRGRVAALRVLAERARPGALHVSSLADAGRAGRRHTFAIGLEEGQMLPPGIEDPVLLDEERERLGVGLPTARDRVTETLHAILSRLGTLGGRVWLSYSSLEVREGRETFPSWLLLQAHRLSSGRNDAAYPDLRTTLGSAVTAVPAAPDHALDDSRWWLARIGGGGRSAVAAVDAAFPGLERGAAAEAARGSEVFTRWDGLVPAAAARLDPRRAGKPISATTLERIAGCPFRHFLERGLGLEAVDDTEPDPDGWLDARTRGQLLHELFAAVLREARERGERVDLARWRGRLHTLAAAQLAALRDRLPPPAAHVHDREVDDVMRDLDRFLAAEALEPGREAVGLEVAFGSAETAGERLGRAEPVTLELDDVRLSLRGGIDRIDRVAPATYEVVDYKTGGVFLPGGADGAHFAGGRQLQHALYALVAEHLLQREEPEARVRSASYYFPSERGGGERVVRPVAPAAALAAVLRDLLEVLARGAFVHTRDDGDCRFCDMKPVCGTRSAARAGAKLDAPANTVLAAFTRLRGHA